MPPGSTRNWIAVNAKTQPQKQMKTQHFNAILLISALTLSSSFSLPALATVPAITQAVANLTAHTLTITGSNFAAPKVTLDNINLTVTSSNATSIVATLPPGITPASYHLVVTVGGNSGWQRRHDRG